MRVKMLENKRELLKEVGVVKRIILVLGGMIFLSNLCYGGITIKQYKGTLRIVRPDMKMIDIKDGEKLGELPSGTWIRVLVGNAKIDVSGVEISLSKGGWINLKIDDSSGEFFIKVAKKSKGTVKVTSGSTSFKLARGEQIKAKLNESTGMLVVIVIKGEIKIVTPEKTITLTKGEKTSVDIRIVEIEIEDTEVEEVVLEDEPGEEVVEENEASPYQP